MSDHEELKDEVPAYVASRLEGEALRRFEAHLETCDDCADLVGTWKEIVSSLRDRGDALFDPHPGIAALREYARARPGGGEAGIARHLATCAACELEVVAWRTRLTAGSRAARPGARAVASAPRSAAFQAPVLWLSAGVIAGLTLAVLVHLVPVRSDRDDRGRPSRTPPVAGWTGPVQLLVLTSPLRGAGPPSAFRIEPGQPFALIAVQPALPETAADAERYRFAIRDAGGALVWVSELDASQIRRHLETTEVVTFAVPSADLRPGRYEMRVVPRASPEGEPLLQVPFDIAP